MKFDTIVIGAGMAGLTCGLKSVEAGLKTAIISSGRSAMHFSSGSIDLLSKTPDGIYVKDPKATLDTFSSRYPKHPYSKIGEENIFKAMNWFEKSMANIGINLSHLENGNNHSRMTPLGTFKHTWLSQDFVHQFPFDLNRHNIKKIIIVSIDGFRDFEAQITADNLKLSPKFNEAEINISNISFSSFDTLKRNHCELRSIDLSRIIQEETVLKEFAEKLLKTASTDDLIVLPAIFSTFDGVSTLAKLHEYTNLNFCEVATLPPSLSGIRLEENMLNSFISKGGTFLTGDEVLKGEFSESEDSSSLTKIYTKKMGDLPLTSDHFVVSSGSFFSKGLISDRNSVIEPIFNLDTSKISDRNTWFNKDFLSTKSHPFLSMGVETNEHFNPSIKGKLVSNIYCAGSVLAHYDPIFEGSGSGVALSTGFYVAEQIIKIKTLAVTEEE